MSTTVESGPAAAAVASPLLSGGGGGTDAQAAASGSKPLHIIKHVQDMSQLPLDYGTTPGGTMFSTTPGGTRIIYKRKELLELRSSPLARTPPSNLANIPGVTSPAGKGAQQTAQDQLQTITEHVPTATTGGGGGGGASKQSPPPAGGDDPQFDMDI